MEEQEKMELENSQGQRMTIDQVLEMTVQMLEGVMIPVGLLEKVGQPMHTAIGNIRVCAEAYRKEQEQRAKEAQESEAGKPDLKVVPEEGEEA